MNSPAVSFTSLPAGKAPQLDVQLPLGEAIDGSVLLRRRRRTFAQRSAHAGQQFARSEGLGEIVAGAQFKADHLVGFLDPIAAHDDDRAIRRACQPLDDIQPILAAEIEVDDEEINRLGIQIRCRSRLPLKPVTFRACCER